jgi:protein-disulfide isomerase
MQQQFFDRTTNLGLLLGLLTASLCLNVYFFVTRIDPDFIPMVLDHFFYQPPVVEADDHVVGPRNAPVRIIEYADYQCRYCKTMNDRLKRLLAQDRGVVWVMRNRPLSTHRYAEIASEAAECANEQGSYWAYNDALFDRQERLDEPGVFLSVAEDLNLDGQKFESCFHSTRYARKVGEDLLGARRRGISRTPTFYINNQRFDGAISTDELQHVVEAQLGQTQETGK